MLTRMAFAVAGQDLSLQVGHRFDPRIFRHDHLEVLGIEVGQLPHVFHFFLEGGPADRGHPQPELELEKPMSHLPNSRASTLPIPPPGMTGQGDPGNLSSGWHRRWLPPADTRSRPWGRSSSSGHISGPTSPKNEEKQNRTMHANTDNFFHGFHLLFN